MDQKSEHSIDKTTSDPEKHTNAYELIKIIFYSEINAELTSTKEKAIEALEKLYGIADRGTTESWLEWFLEKCPDATDREKNILNTLQVIVSSKKRYSNIQQRHNPNSE